MGTLLSHMGRETQRQVPLNGGDSSKKLRWLESVGQNSGERRSRDLYKGLLNFLAEYVAANM